MGEIQINNRDMWLLKYSEVKQLLKGSSDVSITEVSRVGVWVMSGGKGNLPTL